MNIIILWVNFILASLALLYFGYKASKTGYLLSKITLFSETFMGMIFLAMSTSMPEMFISIGAAGITNSGDLASGNIFGTLIINLMIIVLMDIQTRGAVLSYTDNQNQHVLTAILCIMIVSIMLISIVLQNLLNSAYKFFHIGIDSIIVCFIYIISLKLLFGFERKGRKTILGEIPSELTNDKKKLKLWATFFTYIFLVAIFGLWISYVADKIVKVVPAWDHTFFGSIFLALSSSLPEIIVSISSIGAGSVNMAVGNVLGSNLFDTIIIPISDLFYFKNSILNSISLTHVFTAIIFIILTTVVIAGLVYKPKKTIARLSWPTIFMISIFIIYYFFLLRLTY